jgi:predicted NBD/HSP70 family sugar kinase
MHIQPKPRISFGNEVSVDTTLRGANHMRRSMSAVGETPQSSVKDLIRLDHAADPERVGSQGRWGDDSAAAIDATMDVPGGYLIALRPSTPARLW